MDNLAADLAKSDSEGPRSDPGNDGAFYDNMSGEEDEEATLVDERSHVPKIISRTS
jgi:hypothetical protein